MHSVNMTDVNIALSALAPNGVPYRGVSKISVKCGTVEWLSNADAHGRLQNCFPEIAAGRFRQPTAVPLVLTVILSLPVCRFYVAHMANEGMLTHLSQ
jgi:hypothetical protein